jgi:hypothetical protein
MTNALDRIFEIGIVFELENGLVRRAVSYGSQDEARAAASGLHA